MTLRPGSTFTLYGIPYRVISVHSTAVRCVELSRDGRPRACRFTNARLRHAADIKGPA